MATHYITVNQLLFQGRATTTRSECKTKDAEEVYWANWGVVMSSMLYRCPCLCRWRVRNTTRVRGHERRKRYMCSVMDGGGRNSKETSSSLVDASLSSKAIRCGSYLFQDHWVLWNRNLVAPHRKCALAVRDLPYLTLWLRQRSLSAWREDG